jgi:tetratricopeptide (TPR) repeat protein
MATISEALAIAFRHHQAGGLQAAEQIYRQILAVEPHQADAWHLLGIVNAQTGNYQRAAECIYRALAVKPDWPEAHSNLGNALKDQGMLDAAAACFRRALELKPDYADARYNLGNALNGQGKLDEAVACYRRVLELRSDWAEAHNNLGNALKDQRKLDEAVACYRRAVELKPDYAAAHSNLGNALNDQGKFDEAAACCRRALKLNPDCAETHSNLGNALRGQEKLEEAVACYRRALELKPDYAEIHNNLGGTLRDQGKLDEALACCRRALELKPNYAEAHNTLGAALNDKRKLDEAVARYRRALELKPDYAEAHNNLGAALSDQGKVEEAVTCCHRALELKPDFAGAHIDLGNALKGQGKLDEAAACYRRAMELKPDYADAHWNQSLLSLLTGDFQRGWAGYQWRWKTKDFQPRDFSQPLWDGQPLEGRTILLHAEQGLGDTLQFIRYAPLVKQAGARVLVECQEPLVRLLASCRGVDGLLGRGADLPPFDLHAPLLNLPGIFHTSLETIPADVPYLFADPGLAEHWRQELGGTAGFKIGIAWRGSPIHHNDHARSLPLSCFEPLAGLPGACFFSLQKGAGAEELQAVRDRFPVRELGSRLEDFMDTAAVLRNLDLVIACDTAVAHLAGALGTAVWVALPFIPDWRWLLDRSDTPWYPTMRLFRQDRRGDWQGVFRRIEAAIGEHMTSQGMPSNEDS